MIGIGELRQHFLVMEDRACDDIGEIGGEQQVMEEVHLGELPMVGIDKKGYLGKGEERNAEGQDNLKQRKTARRDAVYGDNKKINVLEKAEKKEVAGDGTNQPPSAGPFRGGEYLSAGQEISQDRSEEQGNETIIP